MVAAKLLKYLNEKDENGVVVSSWAEDSGLPGIANCKVCQFTKVRFTSGKKSLTNHSESKKHKGNAAKVDHLTRQLTMKETLESAADKDREAEEVNKKRREFEIALIRSLSNHKISMGFLDCLQDSLKTYCGDAKVVQGLQLHRYKGDYVARNGIGKFYEEETVKMMQDCDGFSISFDESEINQKSELEIIANIALEGQGVQRRHYRTLDLDSGTAPAIVEVLLAQFDDDGIDYKKKLLSTMTDGCNTMQGHKGGVKKLLKDVIPQLVDLGACDDHHISNALKYGVKAFDPDLEEALVHLYMDIGGAKGRGIKRKHAFEDVCKSIGLQPVPIKRYVSTRFRILRDCIIPVVHNWEGIRKYYSSLKKPTHRQKLLKAYFVDREFWSYIKMNFVKSAVRELVEAIDFFEKSALLVHELREKMENVLLKFHVETVVKEADEGLQNTTKKSGPELLEIILDDETTLLSRRKVFFGQDVTNFLKSLSLDPKCAQLDKFYEDVYKFHKTVAQYLIKYFKIGLSSTELEYMKCFSPSNVKALGTSHQMKYLTKRYSKVVENIEAIEGIDKIQEEIDIYTTDDDVLILATTHSTFNEFWEAVADLKECEWKKYPMLPRFAFAIATCFNSNSEAERAFSVQTDIHRDPKRNQMIQETFEAHMQIHYGIEGQQTKENCKRCLAHKSSKTKPPQHCHCSLASISSGMVEKVKKSWQSEKSRQNAQSAVVAENDKTASAKKEALVQGFITRGLSFVTGLKTRKSFYTPELLLPIFNEKKKKALVEDELDEVYTEVHANTSKKITPAVVAGSASTTATKRKSDQAESSKKIAPAVAAKKKKNEIEVHA